MFMKKHIASLCLSIIFSPAILAYDDKEDGEGKCEHNRQFTFSWSIHRECADLLPRGGTSKGTSITLDQNPNEGWLAIQEEGISRFERDRRAILAMAGPYRTSFDFLEVVGYTPDFEADRPYQSWGTEYVYVIEDRGDFISLQHIMVMFFENDRQVSGPMVMKHWRQDWQYEKRELLTYVGHATWEKQKISRRIAKGTWSQAVYQVDDSPRYESYGKWDHRPNFSSWISETVWRPLPRREHSVRDDYHVLEGTNRHTIVPTGWVQEEENYKLVLDKQGDLVEQLPYLSKELGLNRYEKIVDFDFSAGDSYWKNTSEYWKDVRATWQDIIDKNKSFSTKNKVDGQALFMPMFEYAESLKNSPYDKAKGLSYIRGTIEKYVQP